MNLLADKPFMRAKVFGAVALALSLALTYLAYRPGLSGGFLFDDFSNLAVLGYYGRVDTWESLWLYLLSGFSGPTGRPLATLSFLLDANTWPADPLPFKHTNVLIHLSIGAVLYLLVREISRALDLSQGRAVRVALLSTAIWLLHPLWVSTTLYVVQRMAQLSTLFVLLGLWLYLRSRITSPEALSWKAWLQSAFAIGGCGLLAVLSKENGALLPLLAIVLEVTVLTAREQRLGLRSGRAWKAWRVILLGLPVAALALYMAQNLPALFAGNPGTRSFTPGERLLAQGPILWEYIAHLIVPRPHPGHLFNDHIHVSADFQEVVVALIGWGALMVLTALAVIYRTRKPVLAVTFLFFMAGHVLESSFLQLELYFEHRNYLPAALLGLPFAFYVTQPGRLATETRVVAVIGVLTILTALTWHRADLWGKPFQQAVAWSSSAPESARAQHYLAGRWMETGNLAEASRLNKQAIRLAPQEAPWLLTQVALECAQGLDPTESMARVERYVGEARRMGAVVREQLTQYFDLMLSDRCGRYTGPVPMLALVERLDRHSMPGALRAAMYQRAAEARLLLGEPEAAYELLTASLKHMPDEGVQLRNAAILAGYGRHSRALAILDDRDVVPAKRSGRTIERLRRQYINRTEYYDRERIALRARIIEDMEVQATFHLTKEHERTN